MSDVVMNKRRVYCRHCSKTLEKGEGYCESRYSEYSLYPFGRGNYLCEDSYKKQEYYTDNFETLLQILDTFSFDSNSDKLFHRRNYIQIPKMYEMLSVENSKLFMKMVFSFLSKVDKDISSSLALWKLRELAYKEILEFKEKWDNIYTETPLEGVERLLKVGTFSEEAVEKVFGE